MKIILMISTTIAAFFGGFIPLESIDHDFSLATSTIGGLAPAGVIFASGTLRHGVHKTRRQVGPESGSRNIFCGTPGPALAGASQATILEIAQYQENGWKKNRDRVLDRRRSPYRRIRPAV
jgi:hypothetical protein